MGAGIVLFVWLFLAAIGAGLWLAALLVFIAGRRKKSRALSWLGGVPLTFGTLAVLGALGATIYGFHWNAQPANIYQLSFGRAPSADVTALQSSNFAFADSGTTFLRFKAAPTTIRAVTARNWRNISGKNWKDENFGNFRNANTPNWWNPKKTRTTQIFVARDRFGNFAGEDEILIYDPALQQTHYAFIGID